MSDDRIACVLCGKLLRKPGLHHIRAHGMTAAEYRQATGEDSTPRPDTCANGHPLGDAPIRSDGARECVACRQAWGRLANQRPEVAERKSKEQRERRARLRAARSSVTPRARSAGHTGSVMAPFDWRVSSERRGSDRPFLSAR